MTQELLSGLNGYNIPCRHTIQGGESMVCLITHGFGSSKDSPTAQLLAGELPRHGIGTLALDLPAHGDSPVDGDALSIRHCLDDLARAEARALELAPGARVVYFSSSFGAYLNLIYLSTRPHRGTRSFLRSAAVEMPLLFHSPTPEQAEELARQLCDLNRERQAVEQSICADAIAQIERLRPDERNALVRSSVEWHQGVVGIVASRLSEKYAAPSFMIHLKDGSGKGSCRSYGGFNLFSALESCSDLLDGFGGHELAAGFTIPEENIDTFRQRMNRFVKAASGGERAVSCLEVDAAISSPADMTLEQVDHLAQLEPYGSGNPRPVFALLGATVDSVQAVGQGKHLKLRLSKGPSRFDAIFFSMPASSVIQPALFTMPFFSIIQ